MIIEWIYQHRRGLGGGFVTGVLLYFLIALISPNHLMLGVLLFGIFAASTGWGGAIALSILCLLLAGVVGATLGTALEVGIHSFCNRVEDRQISTVLLEETFIEPEPTQNIVDDFSGMEDLRDFKNWGETVRTSLYKKTVAKKIDEVKGELESGTKLLVKHYKTLALKYHPDREPDPSEKDRKKIAFQKLREMCEIIEKHWGFALRGIDVPMYSEPDSDVNTRTELDLLGEYRDLLKEHIELLKKARKEMEDFLNSESLDKLIDEAIDKAIAEHPEYTVLWSKEEKKDAPEAVQEEKVPLNHSPVNLHQ